MHVLLNSFNNQKLPSCVKPCIVLVAQVTSSVELVISHDFEPKETWQPEMKSPKQQNSPIRTLGIGRG